MATIFNLSLDEQIKDQSFSVIESFGLTPSQFMQLVLKQVADTGSLPLSAEVIVPDYTLSENGEKLLTESVTAFENGEYSSYATLDELNQAIAETVRG